MSVSSWETTKQKSKYHFNNDKLDPRWDTVIRLGKFLGNWSKELAVAIEQSKPATWATRAAVAPLKEILATEEYDLEQQGYDKDHILTNLTWSIDPVFQRMADYFALEDAMVRIHVQWPGQCWNLHIDKLEKWCPDNPSKVFRAFIALTDWQQGHFWNYGNYQHWGWKAGDITTFDWQNVPHSTANAGHVPRVTLQVTGVMTEKTLDFLSSTNENKIYQI